MEIEDPSHTSHSTVYQIPAIHALLRHSPRHVSLWYFGSTPLCELSMRATVYDEYTTCLET